MRKISYFNNVLEKTNKEIGLPEILSIIGNGKLKSLTDQIKNEPDKEKRNDLKKKLPAVTISGTFSNSHSIKDFKEHSGLISIDIDDIQEPHNLKERISQDKYTYVAFISPSGKGLKVIVKIEPDKVNHLKNFYALQEYYKTEYNISIDEKCKDLSRLMFLCSDPELFINENSDLFVAAENEIPSITKNPPGTYPKKDLNEDVKNVIRQIQEKKIDMTSDYNEWISIGFSLADEFGEAGRTYFQQISEIYTGYDLSKADKQFNECIKHKKNEGISPLFSIARRHGVILKQNSAKRPNANTGKKNEPIDIDKQIEEFGFYIQNNCYYFRERRNNYNYDAKVSNFVIKVLYYLENAQNGKYIFELTNENMQTRIFEISSESFVNISKFKEKVEPNYLFWGNNSQLYKIKSYIFRDIKSAKEITTLGYQIDSKLFAFSNGIIDPNGYFIPVDRFGVVSYNDIEYYLPAFSEINIEPDPQMLELQKFVYKTSEICLKDWFNLQKIAYGFNGVLASIYDLAAIYSDIVYSETGFFPYLNKFGVKGTAKTSSSELSASLFGTPLQPLNLEGSTTEKGYARRVAQIRNGLVVFEEYTNEISHKLVGFFKGAYNRVGYDRATTSNDNRTHSTSVLSAMIILGNEIPSKKSALFERTIFLEYIKGTKHNPYTKEEENAYKELKYFSDKGIGQFISELHKHRLLIESGFRDMYNKLKNYFKYEIFEEVEISTRTINNICSILTPYYLLSDDLGLEIDDHELSEQILENILNQNQLLNRIDEINVFWQAVEYLYESGILLRDKEFKFITKENIEQLHIRFNILYPKYKEYCIRHKINDLDEVALLTNLKSSKAFIKSGSDKKDSHTTRFKNSDGKTETKSSLAFNYKILNINLKMKNIDEENIQEEI